ncbi:MULTISPECIES: hypothetical protein [Enterobacter cloacae complex]|uniref:hypothetical protein n=1 Tax=Enterobacter cloacae complex TaxID=354276 RepID=UPI003459DE83
MKYGITLGITEVNKEKGSMIAHGMKWTIKAFDELVIVPMLNSMTPADSVWVLKQLVDAGLPVRCYSQHVHALGEYVQEKAEADRKAALEADREAQRIADQFATPEQIAKANAEREANRQAEIKRARSVMGGAGGLF